MVNIYQCATEIISGIYAVWCLQYGHFVPPLCLASVLD